MDMIGKTNGRNGGYLSLEKEKIVDKMRRPVPPNDGTGFSVILLELYLLLSQAGVSVEISGPGASSAS